MSNLLTATRQVEILIIDAENGIKNKQLSDFDIANLRKKYDRLYTHAPESNKSTGTATQNLLVSRQAELEALIEFLSHDFEQADAAITRAFHILPKEKKLASELAESWIDYGSRSSEYYHPRKMTISEHKQAFGNRTPREVANNTIIYIVLGAAVLLGMIITASQIFSSGN